MKNNSVILLLGSNIEPQKNIPQALELLAHYCGTIKKSRVWETEAVGNSGPNFLNVAVQITTRLDQPEIKTRIITPIENQLKRVRTKDKFAPRTIDLDIIIFNDEIVDQNLWEKAFISLPVSELVPELRHPDSKQTLGEIASQLKNSAYAELFNNL